MTKRTAWAPLILVIGLILMEAELILGPARSGAVRVALALPLVLYLPGAAMRRALVRQASDGLADRLLISLGLSLALLAVGGVGLNLLAVGLRPITWLGYIATAIFIAELIAFSRRERIAPVEVVPMPRVPWRHLAAGAVLIAMLATAFAVSIVGAHRQRFPGFVQLWLIPHGSKGRYELGVSSHSGGLSTYTVKLKADGRMVRDWQIRIISGQNWTAVVHPPGNVSLHATLFRQGTPGVYRDVYIRDTPARAARHGSRLTEIAPPGGRAPPRRTPRVRS